MHAVSPGHLGFSSFLARVRAGAEVTLPLGLPFWYKKVMSKSTVSRTRKKIGRPPTGADPYICGFCRISSVAIDAWISKQKDL